MTKNERIKQKVAVVNTTFTKMWSKQREEERERGIPYCGSPTHVPPLLVVSPLFWIITSLINKYSCWYLDLSPLLSSPTKTNYWKISRGRNFTACDADEEKRKGGRRRRKKRKGRRVGGVCWKDEMVFGGFFKGRRKREDRTKVLQPFSTFKTNEDLIAL